VIIQIAFSTSSVIELLNIDEVDDYIYDQLQEHYYYFTWLMIWLKMYNEKSNKYVLLSDGVWSNYKVN
jgi:hypothetical protein